MTTETNRRRAPEIYPDGRPFIPGLGHVKVFVQAFVNGPGMNKNKLTWKKEMIIKMINK